MSSNSCSVAYSMRVDSPSASSRANPNVRAKHSLQRMMTRSRVKKMPIDALVMIACTSVMARRVALTSSTIQIVPASRWAGSSALARMRHQIGLPSLRRSCTSAFSNREPVSSALSASSRNSSYWAAETNSPTGLWPTRSLAV